MGSSEAVGLVYEPDHVSERLGNAITLDMIGRDHQETMIVGS